MYIFYIIHLSGASFGQYIGKATTSQTKDFYNSPEGCPVFQNIWEISPTFQQFITEYFEAHTVAFPTIQEEIIAMAEAMDLPSEIVFIQNACSELYLLFGNDVQVTTTPQPVVDPPIYAPYLYASVVTEAADEESNSNSKHTYTHTTNIRREHCSDIGLIYSYNDNDADNSTSPRVVQGHNEDWWSGVAESMSVVHASDWLGYLYPGNNILCGTYIGCTYLYIVCTLYYILYTTYLYTTYQFRCLPFLTI